MKAMIYSVSFDKVKIKKKWICIWKANAMKKKALKDFVCWHVECIGSISINDYFLNMHESWNWILVPVRRDKIQLMLSELFSMQECQKGKKKWKQTEKKTKGMRYVVKKCLSLLSDSVTCMYSCKFGKKKNLTVEIGVTCPFKTTCLACNIKVVSGKTAVNLKKNIQQWKLLWLCLPCYVH